MQADDIVEYRRFGTTTFPIYILLGKCIKRRLIKATRINIGLQILPLFTVNTVNIKFCLNNESRRNFIQHSFVLYKEY